MYSDNPESADAALADYRQYYGLSEEPFHDDSPFFGGAGRQALLEQLQHLCQFSASLLAVLGPPGVGKTRTARELAERFDPDDEICQLSARKGDTAAQLLGQMAHEFHLQLDPTPSEGRLLAALRHFAQLADEEDRLALAIVDNAHHLDEQTLGALISLLQGQDRSGRRLHIVLFAEPEMEARLDQFNMHDVLIHDLALTPLSLAEATDYLNFRMEMAGYIGPELFTEKRIEPWWRRAEGRIPALHEQARRWLLESVTADSETGAGRDRSPLPLVHMVVVAVLLAVLVMVWLYRGAEDEAPPTTASGAPAEPAAPASEPVFEPEQEEVAPEPRAEEEGTTQAGEDEPAPRSEEPEVDPSLTAGMPDDQAPESAPETEGDQAPPTAAEPPETGETEEAAEQAEAPEPAPEADASAESTPEPSDLPEDERILLSWQASQYTLQLLGAGSRESVERYMREQPNADKLLSFESRRQGEPWFVVITGRFDSAEQARAAVDDLPAEQKKAGPWPRSMDEIQQQIETLRDM